MTVKGPALRTGGLRIQGVGVGIWSLADLYVLSLNSEYPP